MFSSQDKKSCHAVLAYSSQSIAVSTSKLKPSAIFICSEGQICSPLLDPYFGVAVADKSILWPTPHKIDILDWLDIFVGCRGNR